MDLRGPGAGVALLGFVLIILGALLKVTGEGAGWSDDTLIISGGAVAVVGLAVTIFARRRAGE